MARRKRKERDLETAPAGTDREGPDVAEGAQAGDLQGLSGEAEATSESVRELAEEGQAFEAAVVNGVENAPDADVSEVRTRQVPEDDVPLEYIEKDPDDPKE
jgi:hypothetical protein